MKSQKSNTKRRNCEVQHSVNLTQDDMQAISAEIERLSAVTGHSWSVSGYLRMAARAMVGKHLAGA